MNFNVKKIEFDFDDDSYIQDDMYYDFQFDSIKEAD